jgi:hypothetical protein
MSKFTKLLYSTLLAAGITAGIPGESYAQRRVVDDIDKPSEPSEEDQIPEVETDRTIPADRVGEALRAGNPSGQAEENSIEESKESTIKSMVEQGLRVALGTRYTSAVVPNFEPIIEASYFLRARDHREPEFEGFGLTSLGLRAGLQLRYGQKREKSGPTSQTSESIDERRLLEYQGSESGPAFTYRTAKTSTTTLESGSENYTDLPAAILAGEVGVYRNGDWDVTLVPGLRLALEKRSGRHRTENLEEKTIEFERNGEVIRSGTLSENTVVSVPPEHHSYNVAIEPTFGVNVSSGNWSGEVTGEYNHRTKDFGTTLTIVYEFDFTGSDK